MVFTIDEIRHYLNKCSTIEKALDDLSERSIVVSIPVNDFDSLNYQRNDENLSKYEDFIGMTKEKKHQQTLYRNTHGKQGRYWMALSPRWHESGNIETEYQITYWVNYGDDETYGHFTVEKIKEWFNNPDIMLYELGGTRERIRNNP